MHIQSLDHLQFCMYMYYTMYVEIAATLIVFVTGNTSYHCTGEKVDRISVEGSAQSEMS